MKITIVGAGRVGIYLAKYFSAENQEVFLVDDEPGKLAALESDFNLRTFVGEPVDFNILRQANTEKADVFVAVTGNASDNLVACAMAKNMGAKKTIARVNRYSYLEQKNAPVLAKMGVDHIVYPDFLAAQSVIDHLEYPWSRSITEFYKGELILAAITVGKESAIVGLSLKDLFSENRLTHISALRRKGQTIIPGGDDIIESDDILYVTSNREGIDKIKELTGRQNLEIKRVIIMGGSSIAELVVKHTPDKFRFVIIEKDVERCRQLTYECPRCDIIAGDASENDVLSEAGIDHCDAFVATTNNMESNILSCLSAGEAGIACTIAEVEKEQLISKAEEFDISAIISKPVLTAHAIFQLILNNEDNYVRSFIVQDAQAVRMQIVKDSRLTKYPIRELNLPKDVTFGGLIRNGKGLLVTGNTVLKEGDNVIVFCLPGALNKVRKLFS